MKCRSKPLNNMFIYAISLFLMKGGALLVLPLIAHFLSPQQVGTLELLATATIFFSLLVGLAMHENLYRFIGTETDLNIRHQRTGQLYSSALFISVGLAILFSVIVLLLHQDSWLLSVEQLLIIALIISYESALAINLAWLRLQDNAMVFLKISVVSVLIQLGLIVPALIYTPNVTIVFAIGASVTLFQFIVLHIYNGFRIQFCTQEQLSRYVRYSCPLMLSTLVAFGLSGAERWIIASGNDLATLGQYAIAAKFALAIGLLLQPFHMWWMPKRFEALKSLGHSKTAEITINGFAYLCVLVVTIVWASKLFIVLGLPTVYLLSTQLVIITSLIMLFKEMVELANIGILYAKQTQSLFYINIFITSCTFLACWFYLDSGIWAILIILLIAQIIRFCFILRLSQSLLPLPYQYTKITPFLLLTCAMVLSSINVTSAVHLFVMLLLQPVILTIVATRLQLVSLPKISVSMLLQRIKAR
ncbi:lipopolysaccharide biosynthesis protein [Vibrio sinensis]|uniref:Lipopolysaccharide biosynthesis protein n=1 Tax=Vibrio sinensis TaxID=2302434 RepID=A0A3A6Q6R6_9VIBR|nr:oligosaccharide flippase family protein [Vibrio sinensis]RJX66488.1 lipopolysaccharide biosynthesis protein [Vibrio sinensis]